VSLDFKKYVYEKNSIRTYLYSPNRITYLVGNPNPMKNNYNRILILTHPRSGGFSLLHWLGKELGIDLYHEPLLMGIDSFEYSDSICNPNVIVKEQLDSIIDLNIDPIKFINSFDLVIFHTRSNIESCSISKLMQLETGESHVPYTLDGKWIALHRKEIHKAEGELIITQKLILDQASFCTVKNISTTYEGIYETKKDISLITDTLGIYDPKWLSVIDPKRRLQNGDPKLSQPKIKPASLSFIHISVKFLNNNKILRDLGFKPKLI
jgi:hypothetical protein